MARPLAALAALVLAAMAAPAGAGAETARARRARLETDLDTRALDARSLAELRGKLAALEDIEAPRDSSDPRLRDVEAHAVGCGMPCTSGTLEVDMPFFVATVDCDTGAFGLRTGPMHPITIDQAAPQDVTFDGAAGATDGGEVTWYLHEDLLAYTSPTGGEACLFDPPDTPAEPNSYGVEQEWNVNPRPSLDLVLRQEIVAFGSQAANAGLRMTLTLTNDARSRDTASFGVRWWLDAKLADDDGPEASSIECDPPVQVGAWLEEHDLSPAEIGEYLRLAANDAVVDLDVSLLTSPSADHADTATPSRLVVARWANAPPMTPWDYVTTERDATDSDAVVLVYHGHDLASAVTLAPGESLTRSLVLLAHCDAVAPCRAPAFSLSAGPDPACPGETVTLAATFTDPGTGAFDYEWDFGDGTPTMPVTDPSAPVTHDYAVGTFTAALIATDASNASCSSTATAPVRVEPGTPPAGDVSDDLRVSRSALRDVRLAWPTATVAPPSFVVFRTADPSQGVETPAGIGDETVLALTSSLLHDDLGVIGTTPPLLCYVVLPADSCGDPVFP